MRRFLPLLLLCALPALADTAAPPAGLQPLPEPPAPPPGYEPDLALGPQVTITRRGEDKIEEFRMHGKLYMMKVTPLHGVPYYLIDEKGTGNFVRQGEVSPSILVPMWLLKSF
ncbi:MAG: DUF2782 domain-containing protein [Sulfuricella sp.]